MAKISTPKLSVASIETAETQNHTSAVKSENGLNYGSPSAQIISNILNFSKALEVKTSTGGQVFAVVKN